MRRIDLRGRLADGEALDYRALVPRALIDVESAVAAVAPICADVRERGVPALIELAARFDGVELTDIRVPAEVLSAALADLDSDVRPALEVSIERVRKVHAEQRRTDTTTTVVPGGTVTERWVPVDRVGLYVPGGLAVYPSSVVMNVVPAQEAGVGSLAVASPPQKSNGGWPDTTILAACELLGVREGYAVGGGQGVAKFAVGARAASGALVFAPVDLVTGQADGLQAAGLVLAQGARAGGALLLGRVVLARATRKLVLQGG